MRLLNVKSKNQIKIGVKTSQGILDLQKASETFETEIPKDMKTLIAQSKLNTIDKLLLQSEGNKSLLFNESEIEFAPVIQFPEKLLFVGLNYLKHVEEAKNQTAPEEPVLFSKFNNALAAHNEAIPLPKTGMQFDYEAELVVVIGKKAKDVSKEDALSHVFGYTVGNDLSVRDLQFRSSQWLIGKTPDKFAPVGPYIVTADEVDPSNLNISLKRNGELVQSSNTNQMIFDIPILISYASKMMTLQPGDLIFTGTPDGVVQGYPENEQSWLKPGDQLEVSVENLMTLKNKLF